MDPDSVVRSFVAALERADDRAALSLTREDMVFHNVPLAGPLPARPAIRYHCRLFREYTTTVRWDITTQITNDSIVMHERVDVTNYVNGLTSSLPIVGVFEVRGGLLALWRDYWDTATLSRQLGSDWASFYQALTAANPSETSAHGG